MSAEEFAKLVRGRRVGKGKWVGYCASHPDRHPSLAITDGRRGVLIRCMSNGCETKSILNELGLTYNDLFYDNKVSPEAHVRISMSARREILERQLGLAIWLVVVEAGRGRYWAAAERRIRGELDFVRCQLEPAQIVREQRNRQWQSLTQKQKDAVLEEAWKNWQSISEP